LKLQYHLYHHFSLIYILVLYTFTTVFNAQVQLSLILRLFALKNM